MGEVTALASESEAASEEEVEVEVEDIWRFFRPYGWRMGGVAATAETLEEEDG